jgi:glutamate--cysteine ligase
MCRTAAIQVNLDFGDAEDLAKKFALATRLGPVAAAIFANSPFEEGRLSGYKTTRYAAWLETDSDRTGPSPVALDDAFSAERFVEYVTRVPMMFIRRDESYIDFAGHSFHEFVAGCECPETPIFQDFTDHLSTIFTEARLKPHIEQRSADSGSVALIMSALALWKGLMYDSAALDDALRLVPLVDAFAYGTIQLDVARRGLDAEFANLSIRGLASEILRLARSGLSNLAPLEVQYLEPIEHLVLAEGICPADILIKNFEGSWHGDPRKAIEHMRVT